MKNRRNILIFVLVIVFSFQTQAQEDFYLSLISKKLGEKILFIKTGETDAISNILALSTEKGIIVINPGALKNIAFEAKKMIGNVFGSKDFKYVINTGTGLNFCSGNKVYDNALIIGHENGKSNMERILKRLNEMRKNPEKLEEQISNLNTMTNKLLEEVEKGSEWDKMIRENLNYENRFFDDLKSQDFGLKFPDLTFNKCLNLNMGDLTINLIHSGTSTYKDDILIYVPELKLLHVGGVFTKNRVPKITESTDIEKWLDIFDQFLNKESAIDYVIGGRGDIMSMNDVRDNLGYIKDLWNGVKKEINAGAPAEKIIDRFSFDKFNRLSNADPYLPSMPGNPPVDLHKRNVQNIIKMLEK